MPVKITVYDLLSDKDKEIQIEKVRNFIKSRYPNAVLKNLVIIFSKKKTMDIVLLGPRGGETKIVLDDGSGLQKSFLNITYVKRALGRPVGEIITETSADIRKRQKELQKERVTFENKQKNLMSKNEEIQDLNQRLNKEKAKIEQLKENRGPQFDAEVKRKELIKNLEKDLKLKKNEREELQKESKKEEKAQEKIDLLQSSIYEEERQRNLIEERLNRTKTFEVLKENESHLQRLNEEDLAIIQDEMASSFTNALKATGQQMANGLKMLGAKAASALPGLIGSIVSFLFKTAGQAIGFLAKHTWLRQKTFFAMYQNA